MKVERIIEVSNSGGVPTYRTAGVVEGISLLAKRTAVSDGVGMHQKIVYELTTIGKLEEGDRVKIAEVVKNRNVSKRKVNHYKVSFDKTGQSRMGLYELERVPID